MTQNSAWIEHFRTWRDTQALPLWTTVGVDAATQTIWESLNHNGTPRKNINRRQRVQFRQAYVFARQKDRTIRDLGWAVFRRTMDHGFDPHTGYFSTWVDADLNRLDHSHDLYDLAFGVLASAALGHAGYDVGADILRFEHSLDLLKAPTAWFETPAHRLPRRQNPHMHLFEASIALYSFTGDTRHRGWAQTCLDLVGHHILDKNGLLQEYFFEDWTPYNGPAQVIEPGHMAEWIYLSGCFERIMGTPSGLPTQALWDNVLRFRLPSGFLPDSIGATTRRLWPQTELLKAALTREKTDRTLALSRSVATKIMETYLATDTAGGWFDQFEDSGSLISNDMPASTFYHLELAIAAALDIGCA